MVQVLSKLSPIDVSCYHYVHPWTESCAQATCGLFLAAFVDSLRVYSTVYILALLTKGKIPSLEQIKKTAKGILQSTAFLSFTAFGYSGFLCLLRRMLGNYNIVSISGLPVFLSSILAILIERPSRRALLALYVSNAATESVWNMLIYRNMVRPIKYGQIAIFSGSIALLLAYFKAGYHKTEEEGKYTDTMFNILKFIIGPYEEKDYSAKSRQANTFYRQQIQNDLNEPTTSSSGRWRTNKKSSNLIFHLVRQALTVYKKCINSIKCCDRHHACPHPFSCLYYTLQGSTKMFSIGLGLQLSLRLVLNIKTIINSPKRITDILFRKDNLNIASFLGGACGLFRASMCILRRLTGKDSPSYAIPAGLIAGLAFSQYPDTTVALYVFWKLLQITYNLGIDVGLVPNIPGFISFLYCLSTALLFHIALVEPQNLRPSYWKFLHGISGGRVAVMNRIPMDVWGLETSQGLIKILEKTRTKAALTWYLVK